MSMNVTVAEEQGLKRKLQVEVPLDEVRSAYEDVYGRLRANIRVPGFRPGKYPRHLAEKRFQQVMAGEAMQTLVPKYYEQALGELELRPATEPHFDNLDIDKTKPFRFDVEFEIVPSFDLLKPGAFKLTEQKIKVDAKAVEARIEELRGARAALQDKGAKAAAEGDWVVFDFAGTMDGEPFDGGSGENQRIEVGAGQYLPEFDAEFPGIKAGQTKEFDVTFPDDYGAPNLQGKQVHFSVTAKQVEEKVPPELNEEFFKQFGELATLKDFQAHIRKQLEEEQEREAMQAYQNQLADQMRDKYTFDVPDALVEQGLHEFEHQLEHEDPDELLKDEKKLAKRKEEERAKIQANLRVAYAVDALAKEYGVEVSQEEVQQRFFMQAYMMRQNPQELLQQPFGRRMMMQIEQHLMTAQALEALAKDVLSGKGGKAAKDSKAAKGEDEKPAPKAAAKKPAAKSKSAAKEKPAPKAAAKKPAAKSSGGKSGASKGTAKGAGKG